MSDTIAAIATARGPSAIGILRLSGKETTVILDRVFRPLNGRPMSAQTRRSMVLGQLLDSRGEEDNSAAVERFLRCDLLIMDDLGTELGSAFVQSALYRIVNTRLTTGKSTVISTNLSPNDIAVRYSAQILSRFEGEYEILPCLGDDIRILKREKQQ